MPANTAHGLPYPLGTDRVMDGDNAIKSLAEGMDPVIRTTLAPAAGWGSMANVVLVKAGALCIVQFQVTRTGADIVAPATGNLADTTVAGPIPSDMWAPARQYTGLMIASSAMAAGRVNGIAETGSQGMCVITVALPTCTIQSGSTYDFNCVYWLP